MSLLKPLIGWLGRLSVGRKLTLIYLLDLTAVIFVSGILIHEKYLAIDFARKEIVGTLYSAAVRDLLLPPFRDAAPVGPGQPAPTSAERDPARRAARDALDALDALREQHDGSLGTGELSAAWLKTLAAAQAQPPSQRQLGAVARQGRELLTLVGNQSNLILDPDLDSYYAMSLGVLRFPELLEVLHDTAQTLDGVSAQTLRSGHRRTELLILAGRLDAVSLGIAADYQQALAAGQEPLRQAWGDSPQQLQQQLQALLSVVRALSDDNGTPPPDLAAFQQGYGQTLSSLDRAWALVLVALDGLLHKRVDALFWRMWLHLGTALLLLVCILSLVYAVARLISRPLRHLAEVADAVRRTGDHSRRASWHSRDEIGQLVTAFNDMLAQLDRERLTQQELAASARAAQTQQDMVEAIPIAMVVTSVPRHQVLHANAPAQPWLSGRSEDPWASGLEPGVRARFFQRLADQGAVDEFEVRWLGGETPSWAVLSARRLQFQGQDAVLTAFTPINLLKLMEQRLELWAKVFEASSESIIIMDERQRILSVNKAFCRSTCYDYYEVIGEQLSQLILPGEVEHWPASLPACRCCWESAMPGRARCISGAARVRATRPG